MRCTARCGTRAGLSVFKASQVAGAAILEQAPHPARWCQAQHRATAVAMPTAGQGQQKRQPQLPSITKPDAAQPDAGCRLARNITS
jgi:hypothetical protein